MRPNTPKGKIGKRRVFLNDFEIEREFGVGMPLLRVPIWGSQLVSGHWYADVFYKLPFNRYVDRWRKPIFIHFAGYGTVVDQVTGESIVISLFNELINDTGLDYPLKRFGSDLFSLGGVGQNTPLVQPSLDEVEKVKRRASEKRHGWSQ